VRVRVGLIRDDRFQLDELPEPFNVVEMDPSAAMKKQVTTLLHFAVVTMRWSLPRASGWSGRR
jgi:hypothetical protein